MNGRSVVEEREEAHGPVQAQAFVAEELIECMEETPAHWADLSPVQKQSLRMMAVKISRILTGNPAEPDHWLDIQGYAQLVLDEIHGGETNGG